MEVLRERNSELEASMKVAGEEHAAEVAGLQGKLEEAESRREELES